MRNSSEAEADHWPAVAGRPLGRYGERGLAGEHGAVWLFGEVLTVAYGEEPLAQYQVRYAKESRRIAALTQERIHPPRYPSLQPYLWALDDLDWHAVMPLPPYRARGTGQRRGANPALSLSTRPTNGGRNVHPSTRAVIALCPGSAGHDA